MGCDHDKTELILLLFDELDGPRREAMHQQTKKCVDCSRELEELRRGAGTLSALPRGTASEAALDAIDQRLPGLRRPSVVARLSRKRAPAWLAPLAVAAAMLAGVITGLALQVANQPRPGESAPEQTLSKHHVPSVSQSQGDFFAWRTGIDEALATIAREIAALRQGVRGSDASPCAPSSDCGEVLDHRLAVLENDIAWLASAPDWSQRAEL